jgi:hypothetical protein
VLTHERHSFKEEEEEEEEEEKNRSCRTSRCLMSISMFGAL